MDPLQPLRGGGIICYKGSDVRAVAGHDAYRPRTVRLEFASPVKIGLFDRAQRGWAPSTPVRQEFSFRVEESATELVRIER